MKGMILPFSRWIIETANTDPESFQDRAWRRLRAFNVIDTPELLLSDRYLHESPGLGLVDAREQ